MEWLEFFLGIIASILLGIVGFVALRSILGARS